MKAALKFNLEENREAFYLVTYEVKANDAGDDNYVDNVKYYHYDKVTGTSTEISHPSIVDQLGINLVSKVDYIALVNALGDTLDKTIRDWFFYSDESYDTFFCNELAISTLLMREYDGTYLKKTYSRYAEQILDDVLDVEVNNRRSLDLPLYKTQVLTPTSNLQELIDEVMTLASMESLLIPATDSISPVSTEEMTGITTVVTESQLRFSGAEWFAPAEYTALVLGVGGIGSHLLIALTRAGIMCHGYDDDILEEVNLAGQLYANYQVGMSKVDALHQTIEAFGDSDFYVAHNERYTEQSPVSNFTLTGFDSIAAREIAYRNWVNALENNHFENYDPIFIDGRLGPEFFQVICVTKDNYKDYEQFIVDDASIPDLSCTFKQTYFVASGIASQMTATLMNHIANIRNGFESRPLPLVVHQNYAMDLRF